MPRKRLAVAAGLLAIILGWTSQPSAQTALELTIDDSHFKVNDTQEFLVFVSHFDAIHGNLSVIDHDFADLASAGFNSVRILPNWFRVSGKPAGGTHYLAQDTLYDKGSNLRSTTLNKVLDILDSASDDRSH